MNIKSLKFNLIFVFIALVGLSCNAAKYSFVAIKTGKAFMRSGPSKNYPVKWVYQSKGEPLEVVARFESWKKVRDYKGVVGWVHNSVVSSKARAGIIISRLPIILYKYADDSSKKLIKIEPGVRVRIDQCQKVWCKIKVDKFTGWVKSVAIWGAKTPSIPE